MERKLYILFTLGIVHAGGGQAYVAGKVNYLKSTGWKVLVFSCYPGEVMLPELKEFEKYRIADIEDVPSYFSARKRKSIADKILGEVAAAGGDKFGKIVLESTTPDLAKWGEYIAEKLNAKHVAYIIGERLYVGESFSFLNFKLNRRELASIHPDSLKRMFRGHRELSDEESYSISAGAFMSVSAEEFEHLQLDGLPESDYNISYFGRDIKMPIGVVKEVFEFAELHKDKTINFIILGYDARRRIDIDVLFQRDKPENLHLVYLKAVQPPPKSFFKKSDVVLASAGAALLAFSEHCMTLSIDVETKKVIGIVGIHTMSTLYSKENIPVALPQFLEEILIEKKYQVPEEAVRRYEEVRKVERLEGQEKFMRFIETSVPAEYYNVLNDPASLKERSRIIRRRIKRRIPGRAKGWYRKLKRIVKSYRLV